MERNYEVKQYAKQKGVRLWQVADSLGMKDYVFSKKLRYKLPEKDKAQIMSTIDGLSKKISGGKTVIG